MSGKEEEVEEFPGNPHHSRQPAKKEVKKVVQGAVRQQKPPLNKRILHTFFKGEAKQTWTGVIIDVFVPAVKDLAADMVTQGVERMIFGEARSRMRRPGSGGGYSGPTVSYNRYNPGGASRQVAKERGNRSATAHTFDDLVLDTRAEGEEVLEQMYSLLEQYNSVTVSDLNDLVGISGEFTDEKWGWTDLRGSDVSRVRDGYLLNLPRPIPLD